MQNPKANSLTSNFTLIKIHLFVCLRDLIALKKKKKNITFLANISMYFFYGIKFAEKVP